MVDLTDALMRLVVLAISPLLVVLVVILVVVGCSMGVRLYFVVVTLGGLLCVVRTIFLAGPAWRLDVICAASLLLALLPRSMSSGRSSSVTPVGPGKGLTTNT